jgi:hypothetical protein
MGVSKTTRPGGFTMTPYRTDLRSCKDATGRVLSYQIVLWDGVDPLAIGDFAVVVLSADGSIDKSATEATAYANLATHVVQLHRRRPGRIDPDRLPGALRAAFDVELATSSVVGG